MKKLHKSWNEQAKQIFPDDKKLREAYVKGISD